MIAWLSARRSSLTALGVTTVAWLALNFTPAEGREWLWRDYGWTLETMGAVYALLALLLIAAALFEPALRADMRAGAPLVVVLASVGAALSVALVIPDPPQRLLRMPFAVWVISAHGVALCGLAVGMVTGTPITLRVRRWMLLVSCGWIAALVALSVAAVGAFMAFDFPDEVELASLATSYAETGVIQRTFIGGAFGAPDTGADPVAPRYYAAMGLWLRLLQPRAPSALLDALRAFPLLVGGLAALITALALVRTAAVTWTARAVGLATLLAFSAFVRAAHNIRQDIGLALYGALVLLLLIAFFAEERRVYLALLGAALIVGLETIPTAALIAAAVVGAGVVLRRGTARPGWRERLLDALAYGIPAALALAAYGLPRFVLDPTGWERFGAYFDYYAGLGNLGGASLGARLEYWLRFSLILAPLELVALLGALALAWRTGTSGERHILLIGTGGMVAVWLTIGGTYSYMAWLAPFAAFAAALALRSGWARWLALFVLLPALAVVPLRDLTAAVQADSNRRELAEAALLTWRIAPGTTIIGEDVFWFTLSPGRRFIGWAGIKAYAADHGLTREEAAAALDADYLICFEGCPVSTEGMTALEDFAITRGTYRVFQP